MNGSEEFKDGEFHGRVLGELKVLKVGQDTMTKRIDEVHLSLDQFKIGQGARVEFHGLKIVEIQAHQGVMAKIMWVVGTASITALVAAIMRLVTK